MHSEIHSNYCKLKKMLTDEHVTLGFTCESLQRHF